LLRRFEPDSIEDLSLLQHNIDNDDEALRVQALATFVAEVAAGHAALNSCKKLIFIDTDLQWFTPAACSGLLPALMPSKVETLGLPGLQPAALAAVCSPEALAAVTRHMTISVERNINVAAMRDAITAANKEHLLQLRIWP
jgi:hypothetical protein